MKKLIFTKFVLTIMMFTIATSLEPAQAQITTTSFYANQNDNFGLGVPANLPSSDWTNVTNNVTAIGGLSTYAALNCTASDNIICVVEVQITRNIDGSLNSQTVLATVDGIWEDPRI